MLTLRERHTCNENSKKEPTYAQPWGLSQRRQIHTRAKSLAHAADLSQKTVSRFCSLTFLLYALSFTLLQERSFKQAADIGDWKNVAGDSGNGMRLPHTLAVVLESHISSKSTNPPEKLTPVTDTTTQVPGWEPLMSSKSSQVR